MSVLADGGKAALMEQEEGRNDSMQKKWRLKQEEEEEEEHERAHRDAQNWALQSREWGRAGQDTAAAATPAQLAAAAITTAPLRTKQQQQNSTCVFGSRDGGHSTDGRPTSGENNSRQHREREGFVVCFVASFGRRRLFIVG